MLNKLMKYELKATSRLLVPLYLILFVLSIVNRFIFNFNSQDVVFKIVNTFLMISYVISIFAVLIVTVIYMIVRFYKNLLTDEGYLMFTLPTKTHELITSKLIITVLWTIISVAAVMISLFIAFSSQADFVNIINSVKDAITNLNRDFGGKWILALIEGIVMLLLSLTTNILMIYASIALGQLFSKHKIIGSFISYIAIYTVIQFAMIIVLVIFGAFNSNTEFGISVLPKVILPTSIIILAAGSSCFYLGTNYIFKKKLNLD